jgi:Questin oxidase-like
MPGGTTRREALERCLGAAMAWAASPAARGAEGVPVPESSTSRDGRDEDALDEALRLLQRREPQATLGLSTHAPMAAETLCAMGRPERAVAWVAADHREGPVLELPRPKERIDPARWREALGPGSGSTWEESLARWGDWRELFTAELAESPWMEVLDRWVLRLTPGLSAAATHGIIRTAHAARALSRRRTSERLGELSRGLAYWAAAYQELPARRGVGQRAGSYAQALAALPLYWQERGGVPAGNIVAGLREAARLGRFDEALDLVAPPSDVSAALSALSATFTRVYLRHGTLHNRIAFIHAVTGPCALRRIAPHVKAETARLALPYAWQTAAAIYAAYARPGDDAREPAASLGRDELEARAIENGDEHAIKFTEVLLGEHALSPDPAYLAAAQDAVEKL